MLFLITAHAMPTSLILYIDCMKSAENQKCVLGQSKLKRVF